MNREIHLLTHKTSIRGKRKGPGKPGDAVYRGPVNRGFTVVVPVFSVPTIQLKNRRNINKLGTTSSIFDASQLNLKLL